MAPPNSEPESRDAEDPPDLDAPVQLPEHHGKRAAFLEDVPDVPELSELVAAFSSGNYARLRRLVRELEARETDPETLDYAHDLVDRTEADPIAKTLLWLSGAFFILIVIWVYFIHVH